MSTIEDSMTIIAVSLPATRYRLVIGFLFWNLRGTKDGWRNSIRPRREPDDGAVPLAKKKYLHIHCRECSTRRLYSRNVHGLIQEKALRLLSSGRGQLLRPACRVHNAYSAAKTIVVLHTFGTISTAHFFSPRILGLGPTF